jgi:hypothetical protein
MAIPKWMNIAIQIIVALILLLIMYIITLAVLNIDALISKPSLVIKQKEITTIVDGFAGPSFLQGLRFNTINPFVTNYKRIARSANQSTGVSFTYQFWLKVDEPNNDYFKNLVLLLKGDKNKYTVGYYKQSGGVTGNQYTLAKKLPPDMYIACPMIGFGNTYKEIVVRFNTLNDIHKEIRINMDNDKEPSARKNLLSLLPINWTLLTFVFQDNYSFAENYENGIKFDFYVNDTAYWPENSSSNPNMLKNDSLRQNDGDINFLPYSNTYNEFMRMGHVRYYNYAVTSGDVQSTFLNGPPTYAATKESEKRQFEPAFLSALNKVDVYNY